MDELERDRIDELRAEDQHDRAMEALHIHSCACCENNRREEDFDESGYCKKCEETILRFPTKIFYKGEEVIARIVGQYQPAEGAQPADFYLLEVNDINNKRLPGPIGKFQLEFIKMTGVYVWEADFMGVETEHGPVTAAS